MQNRWTILHIFFIAVIVDPAETAGTVDFKLADPVNSSLAAKQKKGDFRRLFYKPADIC
jgi:hypothetical protein